MSISIQTIKPLGKAMWIRPITDVRTLYRQGKHRILVDTDKTLFRDGASGVIMIKMIMFPFQVPNLGRT